MSDTVIVILVVAIVVLAGIATWALATMYRRQRLQERFGPEYERVVERTGSRREAERALAQRAERHDQLHITPLSPARRSQFSTRWRATQARFVDEPPAALGEADELVQQVMAERGYPVGDFDQQTEDLSVEHADVLDHYRRAHT
ncbi:MAG TPA: hypothetical protein VFO65_14655, partial [Acidimicrobiales bacterium]|nr:hypothetical protein [Acidimicrobiales bacterium]